MTNAIAKDSSIGGEHFCVGKLQVVTSASFHSAKANRVEMFIV